MPKVSMEQKMQQQVIDGAIYKEPTSAPTVEINYYKLDAVDAPTILATVEEAVGAAGAIVQETSSPKERLLRLLSEPSVVEMLTSVSRLPVFSYEMGSAFKDNLDLLLALKQIKYFWSVPQSRLAILLEHLARQVVGASAAEPFKEFVQVLSQMPSHTEMVKHVRDEL